MSNMQLANYTSENICLALGMEGFANDWHLANADESIRVLLMPSFHPEVCVSFLKKGDSVSVTVQSAGQQIWHQEWPTPKLTAIDSAAGSISLDGYFTLVESFEAAANPPDGPRFFVLDGMPTHSIHRRAGERVLDISKNASAEPTYRKFIWHVVSVAWEGILDPRVRNALREAGLYANVALPAQEVSPPKPEVRMVVLGQESETAGILATLERHHKHPKTGGES